MFSRHSNNVVRQHNQVRFGEIPENLYAWKAGLSGSAAEYPSAMGVVHET